jgi:hypothetical protein
MPESLPSPKSLSFALAGMAAAGRFAFPGSPLSAASPGDDMDSDPAGAPPAAPAFPAPEEGDDGADPNPL